MDKRAIGVARVQSLETILNALVGPNEDVLSNNLNSDLFKKDGTFQLGKLAELVGFGCEAATFRQNKALKEMLANAHASLIKRDLIDSRPQTSAPTKIAIGEKNQSMFLDWLVGVGTEELPAPVNHIGRLYKKGLWAKYSGQPLLEVASFPAWFNSRPAVKHALEQLDLKVIQKTISTIGMESESISDDMEESMTSALVRRLRMQVKSLKEQLVAERQAREKAELTAKQNDWQASLITTGKIPHKQ